MARRDDSDPLELAAGRERLLQAVATLPLRYAPFYSRLSGLWQLSEAEIETVLTESARTPWRRLWLGIRYYTLQPGTELGNARARLLHFEPGVRFPEHRHTGEEQVLVLSGSYTDSHGHRVGPGDLQSMGEGSEHALRISSDAPCVAAIVQRGLSFSGPLLRRVRRLISL